MSDNKEAANLGISESRYATIMQRIHKIAKRERITNPRITVSRVGSKGDGFIGEKCRVVLQDDNKTLELFVKAAPTDEAFIKAMDPRPIFLLEIMFYDVVCPIFNKFQTERNVPDPFTSLIKCVDTFSEEGNEMLILLDANSLGFEMLNKRDQLNRTHVEFVFTEYGKFHGTCFALKDQHLKTYQDLVDNLPLDAYKMYVDKLGAGVVQLGENGKGLFDPEKDAERYKKYAMYADNLKDIMINLIKQKHAHTILVHGDSWTNNMMFKYNTAERSCPDQMCILDFQILAEASPVFDLSYFLYTSSPKEIFNNLEQYLRVYHVSLSKTIRDFGSNPTELMPFAELKNQWKLYSKYGLMMASMVLKSSLMEEDETMELSESLNATGGADMLSAFKKEAKHEMLYNQRHKDLIEHMIENEFI